MPFSPESRAVIFGLLSAAAMGAADFSGGFATRRISFAVVIAVSHACGLAVLATLALVTHSPFPSPTDSAWAAAAGVAALVGLAGLYQAMAIGRVGLVAPVSAVVAAALPVALTLFTRGLPVPRIAAGFAIALVGIWLVAQSKVQERGTRGLPLALLAGLAFGGFFALLARVETHAVLWPLTVARLASFLGGTLLALYRGVRSLSGSRALLPLLLLAGVLDVGGNAFFTLATRSGRLDIAAVLTSLYPASTILLARMVLRERLSSVQLFGVVVALAAVALIATAN